MFDPCENKTLKKLPCIVCILKTHLVKRTQLLKIILEVGLFNKNNMFSYK